MERRDFTIISTADWDSPIQTNKQYVSKELAKLNHRILYIESLGIRKLKINKSDLNRVFKRLVNNIIFIKRKSKNIWVLSPLLFPGATNKKIIFINRILFLINLFVSMKLLNFKNDYLWTYNPLTLLYLNLKRFKTSIYHAVDAIEYQPFMPQDLIKNQEILLSKNVDKIFVTSKNIIKKLQVHNPNISYFGNVCDFEHFSKSLSIDINKIPQDIKIIKKPIVGFIGSISEYKINLKLINEVANKLKHINFVFIGPIDQTTNRKKLNQLKTLKNIYLIGYREYKDLPYYCSYFDIGWLPLVHNEYTKSMFPLKFFEYLASGLPVVSTKIDSLREFQQYIKMDDDIENLSNSIIEALVDTEDDLKERLSLARENTYQNRTIKMLRELNL
tara:strand:+ start:1632 stop:2795 length:1164 start_codon:yes stop_codon:yes gene_type:complete